MTKQDIPGKDTQEDLTKLDPKEMKDRLAKFQEALKSDTFKDLNVAEIFGIKTETPEEKKSKTDQATIDRLLPAYEKARNELTTAGYDFKQSDTKMSEAEKDINERLEKQAIAKLSEQKSDILKIDPDFPVKIIEELKISTDDKLAVMAAQKEIVERNKDAVKKVQEELTKMSTELSEVKMRAPSEEKQDKSGEDIVKGALAKFGLKVEEKSEEKKIEA